MKSIHERFKVILAELQNIWPQENKNEELNLFSKTRFHQKADFYSLFNAIDNLIQEKYSLLGKDLAPLRADLAFLDKWIEPESEIQLFRKYAIQCVSQSNTIGSRRWRRNVLKIFLGGTYKATIPTSEVFRAFHNILIESKLPFESGICPICGNMIEFNACSSKETILSWPQSSNVFQLSNSRLIHRDCMDNAGLFVSVPEYETGDLTDEEFRSEE